ncbi:RNA-binding S4 domain-containing protein [Herbidospora yilanensis]|uniref:RNA-binding S4 domain-containing protein n=1 Tax=Herbidospora yilanensis TaxID=354426 RepID=UPI0007820355|nr:RNA-binding S4 domain-containing protein [Herbidospora yilanensis]
MRETFELDDEFIPLCDLLKYLSIAESGGEAKYMVAEGYVLVDGEVELRKRFKVRPGHVVSGDGFEIRVVAAR